MKKILDRITSEMKQAFVDCGYEESYAKVTLSNRPDLCEYQCNGAMAAAKAYKKKPIDIAHQVKEKLADSEMFSLVDAVMPGFINLKLNPQFVADYMNQMTEAEQWGCEKTENPKTIVIDYGGANVAKPLQVGPVSYTHLDVYKRQGVDIVYTPAETKFMRYVKQAGGSVLGGLDMLIYQGMIAYELWNPSVKFSKELVDDARRLLRTQLEAKK